MKRVRNQCVQGRPQFGEATGRSSSRRTQLGEDLLGEGLLLPLLAPPRSSGGPVWVDPWQGQGVRWQGLARCSLV